MMKMSMLRAKAVRRPAMAYGTVTTPSIAGIYARNSFTATIFLPLISLRALNVARRVFFSGQRTSRYGTAVRLIRSDSHIKTEITVRVTAWSVMKSPEAVPLRSVNNR